MNNFALPHELQITSATAAADFDLARTLFREYAATLNFDLCFQGFEEELSGLPGKYAPPAGRLLLAHVAGQAAGCVALRPLDTGSCEMKRLYIRPGFRGLKLGRMLAERIVAEARVAGYERMRLDTIATMLAARSLYRSMGFTEIEAYTYNPIANAVYMELKL